MGNNTFSIVQRDKSEFLDVINFRYSSARFIVVKLKNGEDIDGGIEWISGKQESFGKEYYIECDNLKKGKYYCFIEYDWEENIPQEKRVFNLCCYGASDIKYKDETAHFINTKEKFLKKAFLAKLD